MLDTNKRFSRDKWLISANVQKEQGILTQAEIDDALQTWVNCLDGTTVGEIGASWDNNNITDREEWFV